MREWGTKRSNKPQPVVEWMGGILAVVFFGALIWGIVGSL